MTSADLPAQTDTGTGSPIVLLHGLTCHLELEAPEAVARAILAG